MMSSITKLVAIRYVAADDSALIVSLSDGRKLSIPLDWYPRLMNGTSVERNHWRLIGKGQGIHWPDLDEDVSLDGLIGGRRSMEGKASFKQWLDQRKRASKRSA
jgi:hypothetical protein